MGRKQTGDELNARAKANGYKRGAHREEDSRRDCNKHKAPDLATVKDFLRFKAAAGKGMIAEQTTCDSLNTFAEWFFAGFTRVTDTEINKEDRSCQILPRL
jgi:hypothetical protein